MVGLAPSVAQENPTLAARHIDIAGIEDLDQALAATTQPHEGPVLVRDGEAWLRRYETHPLAKPDADRPLVRPGDVTLITGGLGDVGLVLARHLASTYGSRLILTTRTPLPPRDQWAELRDGDDRVARHVRNLLDLEARGATVMAFGVDVADEAMRRVIDAGSRPSAHRRGRARRGVQIRPSSASFTSWTGRRVTLISSQGARVPVLNRFWATTLATDESPVVGLHGAQQDHAQPLFGVTRLSTRTPSTRHRGAGDG